MPGPARRPGLQRLLTTSVLAYVVLLSVAVVAQGWFVNEHAERLAWQSLLDTELNSLLARSGEPGWVPPRSGTVEVYSAMRGKPPPPPLAELPAGLYDEVRIGPRQVVALIRDHGSERVVLALDITEFEQREHRQLAVVAGSSLLLVLLLGLVIAWGVSRMVAPLRQLAAQIGRLRPDAAGQQVEPGPGASDELQVIADAVNRYLANHDRFVARERGFIQSASHELRTPVAVMTGAAELALAADMSPAARHQIERVRRTARGLEGLIGALLVLAKDPERLAGSADLVELDRLLPEIVADHRHLCQDKALALEVAPMAPCTVQVPISIVQIAVGNLLRNAIENSDSGTITIELRPGAVVVIEDPGHGMSPEQIAALYRRGVRAGGRTGGIGLDLVTRLCDHLGWKLQIGPGAGERGTRAILDLGNAVVRGS